MSTGTRVILTVFILLPVCIIDMSAGAGGAAGGGAAGGGAAGGSASNWVEPGYRSYEPADFGVQTQDMSAEELALVAQLKAQDAEEEEERKRKLDEEETANLDKAKKMKHMTDSEAKEQTRKIEDAEALARDRASRASGGTMPTHVEQPRIVY